MPSSVEDKVVKLEFENADFERRTAASIAALQKLEQALQLKAASSGLADVDAASKKLSFEGAAQGVQGLSAKFLALSTVAITALSTITSKAIDAGARIVKSLALDGITSGFKEYELNIGSIQTILSNTRSQGTNLQQVNAALDQLNTYADKTIYNFGQMTRNIGTFTAAGVKLDVALPSIKGIANLAAMSGSSAEQASTAMYQLSQAIASGSLKLMDWNSVVNAGMGGEVFQKSLFEAGKAMKTLKGVDMGTTFEQWKDSGHSFRDSLQDGWITADVLTTVLGGMSGEIDTASLKAKGFSDQQIKDMVELGKAGVDAATKVRTFTGLVGTLKESVGSGWSASFRTIIGNFDEATNLFTGLSNTIGGFLNHNADVRNMILGGVKQAGGFLILLDGLRKGAQDIGLVFKTLHNAFRDIFPRKNVEQIVGFTKSFSSLMDKLRPSTATIQSLYGIFHGLFATLSIGWTIIKEGVKFVGGLVGALLKLGGVGQGHILSWLSDLGDAMSRLQLSLVQGGGIHKFFEKISDAIAKGLPYIQAVKDAIGGFFDKIFGKDQALDKVADATGRVGSRFQGLKTALGKLGDLLDPLWHALDGAASHLDNVWKVFSDWVHKLGSKFAEEFKGTDWSPIFDALNTSLLGGIALLLGKWLKGGINLDAGGGLFKGIKESFEALTGQLQAMQTQVKAQTIEKIAIAVGILTAAVVALSLIDSAKLTKALTAMAVGFGELLGAFKIIDSMSGDAKSAAKFTLITAGLNALASAMVILSGAVAILGNMDMATLAKGLGAVTLLLGTLTLISGPLSKDSAGMVLAGVGITALAVGLNILAGAVKLFSMMSYADLAKGLGSITLGLIGIGLAMRTMPATLPLTAAGLIGVAVALNLLAGAVKIFATMSWEDMGKGAAAIGGGLLIIGLAMRAMPLTLPITAAGLILVGIALGEMAAVLITMGQMGWDTIIKGLTTLGVSLALLSAAVFVMQNAVLGVAALIVAAAALTILAKAVLLFASMSWGDLLKGLAGLALTLIILAGVSAGLSALAPLMFIFGTALLVVGAALLVFGAGAFLAASAFAIFAKVGVAGAEALIAGFVAFGQALPEILTGVAKGLIHFILEIAKGFPPLLDVIGRFAVMFLDLLVKLIPRVIVVVAKLLDGIIRLGFTYGPQLEALGIFLLKTLLRGIEANIGDITQSVINIIVTFMNVLDANMNRIIDAGVKLLTDFLLGIAQAIPQIGASIDAIFVALLLAIASHALSIVDAGVQILVMFLMGIARDIITVVQTATAIIDAFLIEIGNSAQRIEDTGFAVLLHLLAGAANNILKVVALAGDIIVAFIHGISNDLNRIITAGTDLIVSFIDGISNNMGRVIESGKTAIIKFIRGIGDAAVELANAALDTIVKFTNGLSDAIDTHAGPIRAAGVKLAGSIINGITGGMLDKVGEVADAAGNLAQAGIDKFKSTFHINSPSLVMQEIGHSVGEGLGKGIVDGTPDVVRAAESVVADAAATFNDQLRRMVDGLETMDDFSPTVTPVLDLSAVEADAAKIAGYIQDAAQLSPTLSINSARTIAASTAETDDSVQPSEPGVVKFEQNNYSPKALSTADVYRGTRSQIELAKKELSIP